MRVYGVLTDLVPADLYAELFIATPLRQEVAALDYTAYMSSPATIATHSDGRWPVSSFTPDDNLTLVRIHEADMAARRAFAYTLLTPDRTAGLGSLYLNPLNAYLERVGASTTRFADPAAMVTFWIREDVPAGPLSLAVVDAVVPWITDAWRFKSFAFRILPAESLSLAALEQSGLKRLEIELPDETRPYLWFAADE